MTAGSVLVPQVIPLRVPTPGKAKHEIDTTTLVEIKSDTPNVSIYYTIDGSKPQLFRGVGYRDHNTFKYKGPITLPEGKITVKALAVTKDYRESTIVTKVFVVEWIAPNVHVPDEDNDENFLKDLSGQEMENGLSDLKQRNKEVKGENEVSWNGVAQEFKGLLKEKSSLLSHLSRPHLLNNYSSDKEESVSSTLMPQSQMGLCLKCHTTVPVNTPTCLVCEALIVPQLQPQASILLQGKILCVECGAGNPIHIKQCVICESRLPKAEMPAFSKEVPSTAPGHLRNTITCSKCGFINDWNAQICDWCEAKNNSSQTWQQSGSSFPTSRPNLLQRNEQGTQTIGLFYPSSKLLEKKECELVSQKKNKISDRSPLLTAISPGRGYWRKQLDHVCAHLRSYTQNNLEFRTLIGEPQMGTLISATVHKDDYEVSLQLNYALAINKDILTNKPETFHYHDLSLSNTEKDRLYESQVNMASEGGQSFELS